MEAWRGPSRLQVEHYVNYGKSLHLHWTFGKPYTANYVPVIHDIYILYIYSGHIRGDMKPIYWLSELYSLRERKLRAGEEWCDACRHSVPLSGSINRPWSPPKTHPQHEKSFRSPKGWLSNSTWVFTRMAPENPWWYLKWDLGVFSLITVGTMFRTTSTIPVNRISYGWGGWHRFHSI